MSEPEIIRKLRAELDQPITSERQVVYTLVQIRKLIDYQQHAEPFKALKLYCNWVVHTQLDQSAAQQLLDDLNARHSGLHPGDQAQENFMRFWAELSLDRFRAEFRAFLNSHNLSGDICDGGWSEFLRHYLSVIQDCPLTYSYARPARPRKQKKSSPSTKQFDRLVLTKLNVGEQQEKKASPNLTIRWDLYLEQELVAHWDVDIGRGMLIGKILATR
jgi:hypothetical protein